MYYKVKRLVKPAAFKKKIDYIRIFAVKVIKRIKYFFISITKHINFYNLQ